jgi:hypothetical protein
MATAAEPKPRTRAKKAATGDAGTPAATSSSNMCG